MLVVDAPPRVVHAVGELRAKRRVRDATPGTKAPLQFRHHSAETLDYLAHGCRVARSRTGQQGRVLGREGVAALGWLVVEDPAGDHGAEPLPDVAFVQACAVGELRTGGRAMRCRL